MIRAAAPQSITGSPWRDFRPRSVPTTHRRLQTPQIGPKLIPVDTRCYYCGEPADSVDHARPRSLDRALNSLSEEHRRAVYASQPRREIVDACRTCNSVLGSRWFDTLEARRDYVKAYLRRKYARVLASPSWTDGEIATLGRTLRTAVVRQQQLKDSVERRLRWPRVIEDSERSAALNAALSFQRSDRIENSALQTAAGEHGTDDTQD